MPSPNFKDGTIWVRDNLHIMRGMNSECVDLIYLDPPFKSDVKYRGLPTDFGGDGVVSAEFNDMWKLRESDKEWHESLKEDDRCLFEILEAAGYSFGDDMKSYLIYMAARLLEMERILKPTGSIYLHCDWHASHYLKIVMDCILGKKNFRNEIVWGYPPGGKGPNIGFHRKHDILLFYSKDSHEGTIFNSQYTELSDDAKSKFNKVDKAGRRYKEYPGGRSYLDESKGRPVPSWWTDIHSLGQTQSSERTGYPTQKPVALLGRIIQASSNEGDLIFDPFCGCATTLLAAEKLGRKWIGIDISPVARFLVRNRMRRETNLLDTYNPISRTDPPKRTDVEKEHKETRREMRQRLYIEQDERCGGCFWDIPLHILNDDHITPRSQGGQDVSENIQLLCGTCNSIKGDRDMKYLHTRLKELGYSNPDPQESHQTNENKTV